MASCFVTNSLYWSCPFLSCVFANRMHLVNLLFFLLFLILLYYFLFIKKAQLFIDSIRSSQRSTLSLPFQYIALSRQTPPLPNAVPFKIFTRMQSPSLYLQPLVTATTVLKLALVSRLLINKSKRVLPFIISWWLPGQVYPVTIAVYSL